MRCPHCGHDEDRVLDTRPVREGAGIRRRRECLACQYRFTTYEYIEAGTFSVVKKDGRREPFRREKLIAGLSKACEKRPVPQGVIEEIAERIEGDLARAGRAEVKSADIGARVMEELRALDPVAYVRFASVYLNFTDIREFQETIRHLREMQAEEGTGAGPEGNECSDSAGTGGEGASGSEEPVADEAAGAGPAASRRRISATDRDSSA